VLLLDEPFTGVDIPTQEALATLLRQLQDEGQTILMTTHDVQSAVRTCSRLVLINRTIIATGKPEELRDPEVWLRAFGVGASDQLVTSMGGPE
jgi:manganese/iron transport system ATP-binding protein